MNGSAVWTRAALLGALRDDDASDGVRVAVQELRRRVVYEIGAERERALEIWRRKRVVHDAERAALTRDRRQPRDVAEPHRRVGRRLQVQEPSVRPERAAHFLRVDEVTDLVRYLLHTGDNVKLGPEILVRTMRNPMAP